MARARTAGERYVALGVVAVVFVVAGGVALVGTGPPTGSLPWRATPAACVASLALAGTVIVALRSARDPRGPHDTGEVDPPTWVLGVPLACLALAVVSPRYFDSIAREDGVVEWLGALATGCASVWLVVAARRSDVTTRALLLAAAGVLFVLTGEELSWLQRIGEFGTPDVLSGNGQGEANLHNLATDRVQALYYLATSAALVVLPFVGRWTDLVPARLRLLVPGPSVVLLAASSTTFAYARTGNVVHHVTFWTAIGVVAWWARAPRPRWIVATLVLIVGGQVFLWSSGPELARAWAPDEYREMLIGLAFATWAWRVLVATRTDVRPAAPRTARVVE